ncbi:MAG: hypothetical protein V2I36_12465 [Desulfopila sp.]|jgi:hypothetical protein|nr:hypothetical protein [Desulfopila sp.]
MKDLIPDYIKELENMDESEKMDYAVHEMEMIYRSRCVDVPLTSNVKVVEIEKKDTSEKESDK